MKFAGEPVGSLMCLEYAGQGKVSCPACLAPEYPCHERQKVSARNAQMTQMRIVFDEKNQ